MTGPFPQIDVTAPAAQSALRDGPLALAVSGGAHLAAAVVALVLGGPLLVGVNPPQGANVIAISAAWLSTGEQTFDATPAVAMPLESLPAEVTRTTEANEPELPPLDQTDPAGEVVVAGGIPQPALNPEQAPRELTPQPAETPTVPKQSLASPPAISAAATGLQIDVQPGKTFAPAPTYPAAALAAKWEGVVKLRVKIKADGSVAAVRVDVSSGYELLDEAAVQAVEQWRFTPARLRGIAVGTEVHVPIRFQLQQ